MLGLSWTFHSTFMIQHCPGCGSPSVLFIYCPCLAAHGSLVFLSGPGLEPMLPAEAEFSHWPTGEVPSSALDKGHWTRVVRGRDLGMQVISSKFPKLLEFWGNVLRIWDQSGLPGPAGLARWLWATPKGSMICLPTSGLCEHKWPLSHFVIPHCKYWCFLIYKFINKLINLSFICYIIISLLSGIN